MFSSIAVLLLANLYTGSWGAPAQNTLLSNTLNELANTCENAFLSTQIKSKSEDCQILVPPYHEKQFICLLFYDINLQLCNAVASSKLAIKVDYKPKIEAIQDVSDLCNVAKGWNFSNISPVYEKMFKLVFQDPIKCSKVCSADNEDLMSFDSNYYCKYFMWGSQMLKTLVSGPSTLTNTNGDTAHASDDLNVKTPKMENTVEVDNTPNVQINVAKNDPNAVILKPNTTEVKSTSDKTVISNESAEGTGQDSVAAVYVKPVEIASSTKQSELPEADDKTKKTEPHAVLQPANDLVPAKISPNLVEKLTASTKKVEVTSKGNEANELKKDDTSTIVKIDGASNKDLLNQIENPKPNVADPDEYQVNDIDSEETRDGIQDTQGGDDGDDTVLGDLDLKPNQEQIQKTIKRIESPATFEISPKDFYTNTIPDGFSEDDDHFFPFFLTAIIMVVLLYILYHNKSKVSKVVLGLIVEGRQSARRRNSRGHAYRRLDTLEQAMSTNTAAPPSKIIY